MSEPRRTDESSLHPTDPTDRSSALSAEPRDPRQEADVRSSPSVEMFSSRPQERGGVPVAAWAIAGFLVLVLVLGLMFAGRRKAVVPNTIQPLAAYAANLSLSQLAMSESTSLSGGKSTFVDGHIQNMGDKVVTGVTVQVLFSNDEGMPPQLETLPLSLIRMRQPYIDTEPVSAAPLKPGDGQDFRLIFETIPANWNMQMPEVHIIQVDKR